MATLQEPEVQLAQRLASNEKPIRTKALKKLRKYITVRSHSDTGEFSSDELLKLWKGLFYCLWMQDKPLLQEELSTQISALIHSFHHIDGQLLYLESFLQTLKREWTGIDRLRMDKFFQLVRFMFRQTFQMLKMKSWESSAVSRFLELLTAQLLQSSSGAPSGLQFHVLDLYMSELATVGAAELTADQNLIFIEPFCKTAAKTKDRALFGAICNSVLCTIIDQAPFAIDDLMKEVKAAEASDSDSGQASEEDDGDEQPRERKSKAVCDIGRKQTNGNKSNEDDDDDDDDDDDELLHMEEDSDTEEPCDEDVGPVLQFAYAALADRLFGLASRNSTPSKNRQRLYKIIRVLRDLHEGNFPQDEYPEEVSTDEDDDMFGTRKRMKRGRSRVEDDEDEDEGVPAAKKTKGKKKAASKLDSQSKEESGKDEEEPADFNANHENKKKKKNRRRKKKTNKAGPGGGGEGDADRPEPTVVPGEVAQTQCRGAVAVTEAETVLLSEEDKQLTVLAEDSSEELAQKKEAETSDVKADVMEAEEQQTPVGTESSPEGPATVSGKRKKRKSLKAKLPTNDIADESWVTTEVTPVASEESADTEGNAVSTEADLPQASGQEGPTTSVEKPTDSTTPINKKKSKKNNRKADEAPDAETQAHLEVEEKPAVVPSVCEEASPHAAVQPIKKKKKAKQAHPAAADESTVKPLKKKKTQKEPQTSVDKDAAAGTPQAEDAEFKITMATPAKKKKKKKLAAAEKDDETHLQVDDGVNELPADGAAAVSSSGKGVKKKRKIPVTFEYEADELEAASTNGLAEEPTVAKKPKAGSGFTKPSISKKSQKKAKTSSGSASDLITFQMNAAAPPALFCSRPLSGKKKIQTPPSESKKVTFGLKNNKTAEFRKTDRSLLLSPDGSSRVPFDPKQKPKFGVLKSPPTPLSARKTPKANKKSGLNTPKETPKRRPSAADFF